MANDLQYSPYGLMITESFEGCVLHAYRDVAGVLSIGYGHTGSDVQEGQVITQAQAEILLKADIASSVVVVNHMVQVPLNQNQFDALVDFVFNVGQGNFYNSTLLRKLNAGDYAGAAEQFSAWVYAGGEVQPGLVRRRDAEAGLFNQAVTA